MGQVAGEGEKGKLVVVYIPSDKEKVKKYSHPSVAGKGRAEPDFAVESFENRICPLVHVLQCCA